MVETDDADETETDAVLVVDEIVIVGAIDEAVDADTDADADADDAIVARVEIIVEGFVDTALVVEAAVVLSLFKQLYFVLIVFFSYSIKVRVLLFKFFFRKFSFIPSA